MNSIADILQFNQDRDEALGAPRDMTRADFATVFEEIKSHALSAMTSDGQLPPTVYLPSLAGEEIVKIGVMDVSPLVNDPRAKDALGGLLTHMLTHPDHDFCVFAHEAWVLKADALPGETPEQARDRMAKVVGGNKSISEMPERQEAVVLMMRSKTEQAMAMLPIVRDEASGQITAIEPGEGLIFPDAGAFMGRFAAPAPDAADLSSPLQNAPSTSTLQ